MKKMKLKKRSDYKTENGYLNYLWRMNKERIQDKTPEVDRSIFKARIREIMDEQKMKTGRKYNEQKAVDKLLRTEEYLSKADRLAENALAGIRKDKQALDALRKVTGWKDRLDPNKLRWDSKNKMYVYEGKSGTAYVSFTNSPKSVKIFTQHVNPVTGKTVWRQK